VFWEREKIGISRYISLREIVGLLLLEIVHLFTLLLGDEI